MEMWVSMKAITLRTAKKNDAERIAELYDKTIGQVRHPYRYCMRYIRRKKCIVMESNGALVGAYMISINTHPNPYSSSRTQEKRYCWLEQIMVLPDHQGMGYGTLLIKDFMERYKEYEQRLICKPKLVSWYRMFGFRVIQFISYRGRTQAIMSKL